MEISAPVKIMEGSLEILGITVGVVPGSGDCALISSPSAVNVYSLAGRNIKHTWTFPINELECLTKPAYVANDQG